MDILFSLCRIAEIWLTKKQGESKGLLTGQLSNFFKNQHSQIIGKDLRKISELCKDKDNREKYLKRLLDNKQVLNPKSINKLWEFDLILIHVLRNEAGHKSKSSNVVSARFEELLERVFFGLFYIVETIYR